MEYNVYAINSIILICIAGVLGQRTSSAFNSRYGLSVDEVLRGNQHYRLWSAPWIHDRRIDLLLNILALLCLGCATQSPLSTSAFLFIFLASAVGGNILALYVSRNDQSGQYHATGAAGGVGGVLMASLTILPSLTLDIPGTVITFPLWPLTVAFVAMSVFATKSDYTTTHHNAHLGGIIIGLLLSPLVAPDSLQTTLWLAILFLLPTVLLFYGIVKAPVVLSAKPAINGLLAVGYSRETGTNTLTEAYPFATVEEEMNALLDRITQCGYQSLSDRDVERLRIIATKKEVG